jgi:hypothetical protein
LGAVAKAGDTMTGTLNLPSNGLVVGTTQLVASGGNVGVGTDSPTAPIQANTATSNGIKVLFTGPLGSFSGGTFNLFTTGVPTATGQRLGRITFGFENESYISEPSIISAFSDGVFTQAISHPSRIQFETAPENSVTRRVRMVIKNSGNIGINSTDPTAQLQINTFSSSKVSQIIQLAASQTADALQVQNSAGTVLMDVDAVGVVQAAGYKSSDGSAGWTGTFTGGGGETVTVKNGLITNVV